MAYEARTPTTLPTTNLSPRQLQIIRLLAQGVPQTDIAAHLHISPHTLNSHLRTAFARLGTHTAAHACILAQQQGLLD